MAGKLLNSCYFYVVLAHIPAGGLCTNQGASAAPPVIWVCQVKYNPSVSLGRLEATATAAFGNRNKKVVGTLMFSHKKGVKKLLFVGLYSLSVTSDVAEEVPQETAPTQPPSHQLIHELQHQTLGFGNQLDDEDASLQVQPACLWNSKLFVRQLPAKVEC